MCGQWEGGGTKTRGAEKRKRIRETGCRDLFQIHENWTAELIKKRRLKPCPTKTKDVQKTAPESVPERKVISVVAVSGAALVAQSAS